MSCGGFLELMVLAHRGGLLFSTDAELLLERLDGLCAAPPEGELSLRLETAEDRAVVLRRLARLSDSSELRETYVTLVRDMWNAIAVDWELSGRGAVDVAVAGRRALVEKGADWHEVARSECAIGDMLELAVATLGPTGEIVVVPAFFTHKGLLVDLPGVVVAGVRVDTTGAHARLGRRPWPAVSKRSPTRPVWPFSTHCAAVPDGQRDRRRLLPGPTDREQPCEVAARRRPGH